MVLSSILDECAGLFLYSLSQPVFCIFFVDPDMFPHGCGLVEVAAMLGE